MPPQRQFLETVKPRMTKSWHRVTGLTRSWQALLAGRRGPEKTGRVRENRPHHLGVTPGKSKSLTWAHHPPDSGLTEDLV